MRYILENDIFDWEKKAYKLLPKKRYISYINFGNKRLLLTPMPPFGEVRNVEDYISKLKKNNVKTIVVFLEDFLGKSLVKEYEDLGMNVIHFPIDDYSTPKRFNEFLIAMDDIERAFRRGNVAMHCFGGNGRTGMMAAAYFIKQGMTADEAIKYVRKYRPEAIEMTSQERYLKGYEYYLNINK